MIRGAAFKYTDIRPSLEVNDILHCYRVAELSFLISIRLNLSLAETKDIFIAGMFHDIGKSMIPDDILNKPKSLSEEERKIIATHVNWGVELSRFHLQENVLESILGHHENYDGTGYPDGLKGEEIPLGARILKVCDIYDALTEDRAYRKKYTMVEALLIMENERKRYDPKIFKMLKEVLTSENKQKVN